MFTILTSAAINFFSWNFWSLQSRGSTVAKTSWTIALFLNIAGFRSGPHYHACMTGMHHGVRREKLAVHAAWRLMKIRSVLHDKRVGMICIWRFHLACLNKLHLLALPGCLVAKKNTVVLAKNLKVAVGLSRGDIAALIFVSCFVIKREIQVTTTRWTLLHLCANNYCNQLAHLSIHLKDLYEWTNSSFHSLFTPVFGFLPSLILASHISSANKTSKWDSSSWESIVNW